MEKRIRETAGGIAEGLLDGPPGTGCDFSVSLNSSVDVLPAPSPTEDGLCLRHASTE